MTDSEVKKLVEYWFATAEHDRETMEALYTTKRYDACLFFGHIILEKILKGLVVQETKQEAPYVHDLMKLSHEAGLNLSEEELAFLALVNEFNIRARYPEHKLAFYKKCTKEYTDENVEKIKAMYQKLCQKIKHE